MTNQVSFFRVPLGCEAAPGLGCGTLARPVLAAIESQPGVREAWLSKDGTVLAIVWMGAALPIEWVLSTLETQGIHGVELGSTGRHQSGDSFPTGGWVRPARLRDLSAAEARVIAVRVVRRVEKRIALEGGESERLADRLTSACEDALANASTTSAALRQEQIAQSLLRAGKQTLDAEAYLALEAAVALGHRPLPHEH